MADGRDQEAVTWLRQRDIRGFDLAYQTYASRIMAFLVRLSGRRDVAEDVFQHTFLRLAERGSSLPPDSDLRAWLFTVARNAYLSRARQHRAGDPDADVEALEHPAVDAHEARLVLGDLESALARLRVDDRELLLLIGVEQLDQVVVCDMLNVAPHALRQRLLRARGRLQAELERKPAAPPTQRKRTCP